MDLRAFFLPEPRRRLPHARTWNVGARTVHLAATGVLLGGHFFGVEADALLPWLYAAMVSGAVMFAVELYPSLDYLAEIGGLAVLLKLALLCAIPFAWSARVPSCSPSWPSPVSAHTCRGSTATTRSGIAPVMK